MPARIPVDETSAPAGRRRLSPKKLLQSKWTAVTPHHRELHFVVTRIVGTRLPGGAIQRVELRAVHSGRSRIVEWRELADEARWHRGWL